MPRLSAIQCEPLRMLLDQQRFTPRETLLRHVDRAEQLATEIRQDIEYPEDWIAFRITAYRPDLPAPALVPGKALLADLSALVEHLCEAAGLQEGDVPTGSISVDDLAARWHVARRTVERYRRRGLIARRWRDQQGMARLAIAPNIIAAFEQSHEALLARARTFSRIDPAEAHMLADAASHAMAASPRMSITRLADEVASRSGRSVPAVRRVLTAAEPTIGTAMPASGSPHLSKQAERRIARAYAWGIRPGLIAERYGCTRLSVHRAALRAQIRALQRTDLPASHEPLDLDALDHPFVLHAPPVSPILDARALLEAIAIDPPIDGSDERVLLTAHRALLERAGTVMRALDPARPNHRLLDRAQTDLRWALRLRARALEWQRGLMVRTIESRTALPWRDLAPAAAVQLHLVASRAAIDAIARFDPRRGGRLAAPVSIAANRAIAAMSHSGPLARTARAAQPRFNLTALQAQLAPWQHLIEPHPRLADVLGRLPTRDASLLAARYALPAAPAPSHPKTIAEVAQAFGVTPARIVGAERRARRAIRALLA